MALRGPLSNLMVVALEQAVAAPQCSCRLADAGARVIKIERAEGDFARHYDRYVRGESTYFTWLNRGKESLVLDIKREGDLALLAEMIARADVFIQNLAPGATARLGLDSATLRARHPRLITCDISGYGEDGPYRDMRAYDLLVQAESGLASVTGGPEGPARVGVSVCDIATGLFAFQAVLLAVMEREKTGLGSALQVSLFDSMAEWMNVPYLQYAHDGSMPARPGLRHPTIAPYGVFDCRDGKLLISIQNEREWRRLCADVLGDAGLADHAAYRDNPARVSNRATLDAHIQAIFAAFDMADLAARLLAAQIAFGRLNDVAALAEHPQLRRVEVETPAGPVTMIAPAARIIGREPSFGPVPRLGQHSESIRKEFA